MTSSYTKIILDFFHTIYVFSNANFDLKTCIVKVEIKYFNRIIMKYCEPPSLTISNILLLSKATTNLIQK